MKAFVLAGGIGSRLAKEGIDHVAKPLLEVGGNTVLEWNIENLKEHGVKTVVLGVGHRSKEVEDYFAERDLGVELVLSFEEERMGTAGALKLAEKNFSGCENFFMCNGDEVKQVDYSKLLQVHKEKKAVGTLALFAVEDVSHYGVVRLENGKILEFVEKPSQEEAPSNLISAGAYVLEKEVFELIDAGREVSIEKEVFPKIVKQGKLFGCECVEKFHSIDTAERYKKTLSEFKG